MTKRRLFTAALLVLIALFAALLLLSKHGLSVTRLTLEFSGPFLGLIEIAHCYELAIFFGLMMAFWHTSLIAGFLLAFCSFLFLLILDNAFSRLTSYWMLRYMWTVPLTLALANLIWLWR